MQVIMDSSFARPCSAPIWRGKKGEFRDWTRCYLKKKYFFCSDCTHFNTYTHDLLNWELYVQVTVKFTYTKLKFGAYLNTHHRRLYRNLQFLPILRIGLKRPAYLKRINERPSCRFLRRCLRLRLRNLRLLCLSLLRLRLRLRRRLKRRLLRIRLLRPRCPVIETLAPCYKYGRIIKKISTENLCESLRRKTKGEV